MKTSINHYVDGAYLADFGIDISSAANQESAVHKAQCVSDFA